MTVPSSLPSLISLGAFAMLAAPIGCQTLSAGVVLRPTTSIETFVDASRVSAAQGTVVLTKTSAAGDPRLALSGGIDVSGFGVRAIGQASLRLVDILSGVHVSAGLARATFLIPTLSQPIRPYVLVGTDSTPSTPHDTLTAQQAAERVASARRLSIQTLTAPVLTVQSQSARVNWWVRFEFPRTACDFQTTSNGALPHVWIDADAIVGLSSIVGIELSAGSYRHSAVSAVDNGRPFGRLGIAIRSFGSSLALREDSSSAAPYVFRVAGIDSANDSPGQRVVRLQIWALRASHVAIRGDFSAWSVVPMTSVGEGVWVSTIVMSPGLHNLSLTLDGRAWTRPAALPASAQDFDSAAGMFIVP